MAHDRLYGCSVMQSRLLAFLLVSCRVMAADSVQLKNGNRLTGKILKLQQEKLALETDYAGTIVIAWTKVENVSTEQSREVELANGRRLSGVIHPATEGLEISLGQGHARVARI